MAPLYMRTILNTALFKNKKTGKTGSRISNEYLLINTIK